MTKSAKPQSEEPKQGPVAQAHKTSSPKQTDFKQLYRSSANRILGGVAGGMAEYAHMDSTLMRLLFVVAAILTGGVALVVYLLAWIIIPENPTDVAAASGQASDAADSARRTFGFILVALGAFFLAQTLFGFDQMSKLWPLILVIIGLAIILGGTKRS